MKFPDKAWLDSQRIHFHAIVDGKVIASMDEGSVDTLIRKAKNFVLEHFPRRSGRFQILATFRDLEPFEWAVYEYYPSDRRQKFFQVTSERLQFLDEMGML